jgi:hypothetical protein
MRPKETSAVETIKALTMQHTTQKLLTLETVTKQQWSKTRTIAKQQLPNLTTSSSKTLTLREDLQAASGTLMVACTSMQTLREKPHGLKKELALSAKFETSKTFID